MRSGSEEDLVEELYAGACSPSGLKSALHLAVARLNANGGNIHVVDKADLSSSLFVSAGSNYRPDAIAAYFGHWRHINPYRAALRRANGVFACHEHLSEADLARSAYAQEFYFRMGERWLAGAVANSNPRYEVSLVFNRTRAQGSFSESDKRLIGDLLPHVRRVAALTLTSAMNSAVNAGLGTAFAVAARPAWLMRGDMRIVWMNAAAEALLREDALVRAPGDFLQLNESRAHARLARAVQSAAGRELTGASADILRCGGADRLLELSVLPATIPDGALRGAQSLVVVIARECGLKPNAVETLMELFALTPTEAQVAIEVASGTALEDIAGKRGVSFETIRTQTRSSFCKTATRRQSELAALVWKCCGA